MKRNHFYTKRPIAILAAAACLVFVFTSVFQMQTMYAQAAYVELTGPTELGISLNKKNEVLKIVGLNDSGKLIADEVDVKHMSYEEALDVIMSCDAYQQNADLEIQTNVNVDCEDEGCWKRTQIST